MALLLVLFIVAVLIVAFFIGHIYLQSVKFPGVKISIIVGSFLIKSMIKILGPRMKIIEKFLSKPLPPSLETESLKIETIPITFDTSSSELYLKENLPISHYSLRIYQPKSFKNDGYPIVMYIHGGGWMLGSIDSSNQLCLTLSKKGFLVVSVAYRKTPEHVFPSCLNDNLNALSWIGKNYQKFNGNISQLTITGESSGAHLAITTQIRIFSVDKEILERENVPQITQQGLLYPVLEYYKYGNEKYDSYKKFRDCGLLLDGMIMDMFWSLLIGNLTEEEVKSNRFLSPLSAIDLSDSLFYSKFPKGFVWLAEYDVVRDEGELFANLINKVSNGKLKIKEWKCGTHGFRFKRNYNDLADAIVELLQN